MAVSLSQLVMKLSPPVRWGQATLRNHDQCRDLVPSLPPGPGSEGCCNLLEHLVGAH